jgi:hypothetical protein
MHPMLVSGINIHMTDSMAISSRLLDMEEKRWLGYLVPLVVYEVMS